MAGWQADWLRREAPETSVSSVYLGGFAIKVFFFSFFSSKSPPSPSLPAFANTLASLCSWGEARATRERKEKMDAEKDCGKECPRKNTDDSRTCLFPSRHSGHSKETSQQVSLVQTKRYDNDA